MQSLIFGKDRILDILKQNRETHQQTYLKALDKWKTAMIDRCEEIIENINADSIAIDDITIELTCPTSYKNSYDTVIQMLELADDMHIELTQAEFRQYIQDQWSWKETFTYTNATYGVK